MIYDVERRDRFEGRDKVLKYLLDNKDKYKRIIDIGGAQDPWAKEVVTAYIDAMDIAVYSSRYEGRMDDGRIEAADRWTNDLDDEEFWREFVEYEVIEPYDFAICSHVLEHVSNPYLLLRTLPKIAREGWVACPTPGLELKWRDSYGIKTRGGPFHRWVVVVKKDENNEWKVWMYPKYGFVQTMDGLDWAEQTPDRVQVSFYWKEIIPFSVFNEGDTPYKADKSTVLDVYRKAFREGV